MLRTIARTQGCAVKVAWIASRWIRSLSEPIGWRINSVSTQATSRLLRSYSEGLSRWKLCVPRIGDAITAHTRDSPLSSWSYIPRLGPWYELVGARLSGWSLIGQIIDAPIGSGLDWCLTRLGKEVL